MAVPHAPMQENRPPTQQNFCATLIIPGIPVFYKGKSPMGLCAVRAVQGLHTTCTALLFAPQRLPAHGGRECPAPTGPSAG